MNDIDILNLDEDLCKEVLNTLVKRAYGYHSKICVYKKHYMRNGYDVSYCSIKLNIENAERFILGYYGSDVKIAFDIYPVESFSYKNLLFKMIDFVKTPNSCISYLPDKPHLIDSSTSLEEVLINLDLTHVE